MLINHTEVVLFFLVESSRVRSR